MTVAAAANRNWEQTFTSWSQPPSQTEQDKCENAERAIRKAISQSSSLSRRTIDVFAQGSYRNRTNVRQDSDVDICVRCRDTFYYDLPQGTTYDSYGIQPATYDYSQFKSDVGQALISYFGSSGVTRGNKAFDVHENTYRIDADVVAAFEYRLYDSLSSFREGTRFFSDSGGCITNWPQQNYDNGVAKNDATGRRFKPLVRILKRLCNEMRDVGIAATKPIASFLIECLVFDLPSESFVQGSFRGDVRYALAHLWNNTRVDDQCKNWVEVNDVKYLFYSIQPWTRSQVNSFIQAAWDYVGFD